MKRAWAALQHLRRTPLPFRIKITRVLNRRFYKDYKFFHKFPAIDYGTILDIGAHRGEFAKRAWFHYSPRTLCLVEADPKLAEGLRRDIRAMPGAGVVHAAITELNGPVTLRLNEHDASSSLLPIRREAQEMFGRPLKEVGTVTVPGLTLDELFQQLRLGQVDLMKVDIQGAERGLLQGGRNALRTIRVVYLEVLFKEQYENCALFGELHDRLNGAGFTLQFFDEMRRGQNGDLLYANACYFHH